LLRELEDKENQINKVNTLLETTKEQKDIIEQNLDDERAKTAKMLD
jgi:predicted  nucleic acid-binding Zn-ribbon protein